MKVICLHNVVKNQPDAFDKKCSRISVQEFTDFLAATAEDYEIISFSQFLANYKNSQFDPRQVTLSFDDGFQGVYQYGLPILKQLNLDAAIFVNPPFVVGDRENHHYFHFLEIEVAIRLTKVQELLLSSFSEPLPLYTEKEKIVAMKKVKLKFKVAPAHEREALHRALIEALKVDTADLCKYMAKDEKYSVMTMDMMKELQGLKWTLGSHTLTHRAVSTLPKNELIQELQQSKDFVVQHFAPSPLTLAYPYGEAAHIGSLAPKIAQQMGYELAFTTIPEDVDNNSDPLLIPRIDFKEFCRDHLAKRKNT